MKCVELNNNTGAYHDEVHQKLWYVVWYKIHQNLWRPVEIECLQIRRTIDDELHK